MAVLGKQQMPKRGQAGVDGVQKPELRYVAGRHASLKLSCRLLLFPRNHGAFVFQDLDQTMKHAGQMLTCAQPQAGRNKSRVEKKITRPTENQGGERNVN